MGMGAMGTPASDIIIVHEVDLQRPRVRGGHLRAYCHLHGGDHQRSLSIALEGVAAGYGWCHNAECHAKVFVPELAPPGTHGPHGSAGRTIGPPSYWTAETVVRRVRQPRQVRQAQPSPAEWQREELMALQRLEGRMRARLADDQPRTYLAERCIPMEIAIAAGVGYIPADAPIEWREVVRDAKRTRLPFISGTQLGAKWCDRLVFPLASPAGPGYAGRSLYGWQPGMDENEHKALLEANSEGPRRWEKTYPAGWFGYDALATARQAVICEGPFDRLALLAAGLDPVDVVALVGTAAQAEWIPDTVQGIVLALDGDGPGRERSATLRYELRERGLEIVLCSPPTQEAGKDVNGKDWSERWRRARHAGVWPVFEALDMFVASPPSLSMLTPPESHPDETDVTLDGVLGGEPAEPDETNATDETLEEVVMEVVAADATDEQVGVRSGRES